MPVAAVVLATGSQDGADPLAALWPWGDGATLIEFQIAQLQAAGVDAIEVVLGDRAERVIPLIARGDVEPIVNPRWRDGVASSIRAGAAAVPRGTTTAIIVDVAEPRPAAVFRRLLQEHAALVAAITRPSYEGTPGTPIVLNQAVLSEARNLDDPVGLQALLDRHADEIHDVPFENGVVLLHVRSSEECERAREAFGLG